MKRIFAWLVLVMLVMSGGQEVSAAEPETSWWGVRSVDTMKYSRDLARAKLKDPGFDSIIEMQMKNIAGTGASHAAIGTPYDEEFTPFLRRWVAAARKYGLKVWFRGNWSGWEGWFGYAKISRDEHISRTVDFIAENRDMFSDGDIFTPCPECENGGPGDPRTTGDVEGFRKFLTDEYRATRNAFWQIHQLVPSNYASMNADVARLIMDKNTTAAMGGLVVIDHYVADAEKMALDVAEIADRSGGQVVLGEFGVPVPDIHGVMNEDQQADWTDRALNRLTMLRELSGLNYWVNVGGSTGLWDATGSARKAVGVIGSYYSPQILQIQVKNEANRGIMAEISYHGRIFGTDEKGVAVFPVNPHDRRLEITAGGYKKLDLVLAEGQTTAEVILTKVQEGWIFRLQKFIARLSVQLGMWGK